MSTVPPGSSKYDLRFNDVSNADSQYKILVQHAGKNAWWDRDNVTFPNFQRWEQYVNAIVSTTNHKVIVWQIPVGNQRMRTMNNSAGHYQDNRVEYFGTHTLELVSVGVIALLFGAGLDGDTVQWDGKKDGVTNPAAICSTNGSSSGTKICSSKVSTVSDDDGGLLRHGAANYYASGGTPLPPLNE